MRYVLGRRNYFGGEIAMNYKCMNAECGWTGDESGTYFGVHMNSKEELEKDIRCRKCDHRVTKINYTRVPPTEPGEYWYKDADGIEELVQIYKFPVSNNIVVLKFGDDDSYRIDEMPGEWSERIEPPE
jgi:DNA-directed RNA polymerase subunit RPC12/RpoP